MLEKQSLDLLVSIEAQTADDETRTLLAGVVDDLSPLAVALEANRGDMTGALQTLEPDVRTRADARLATSIQWWGEVLNRARGECDAFDATDADLVASEGTQSSSSPDTATADESGPDGDEESASASTPAGGEIRYTNDDLGVSFSYPDDGKWQVDRLGEEIDRPGFDSWLLVLSHPDGGDSYYMKILNEPKTQLDDDAFGLSFNDNTTVTETTVGGIRAARFFTAAHDNDVLGPVGDVVSYDVVGENRAYKIDINLDWIEDTPVNQMLLEQGERIVASIELADR